MPDQTGPTTPEGKTRSSMNAVKLNLTGRTVLLPSDSQPDFEKHINDFLNTYRPANVNELELVRIVAEGYWRLRRIRSTEEAIYALGHAGPECDFESPTPEIHAVLSDAVTFHQRVKTLGNLTLYEQRIQRGVEKATKELKTVQQERRQAKAQARAEALKIHKFNKMVAEHDPDKVMQLRAGDFVFSTEEMDRELILQTEANQLQTASKAGFSYQECEKKAA